MWGRIYSHGVLLILANIIIKVSCKETGSLTFLIDDTLSMTDDINRIRRSVDRISDIVFNKQTSLIDNMVLVTFNDPDAQVRVATKNYDTFKRTLGEVYAHNINIPNKWDCWEPSMKGLLLALETSNSNSFIYVFTDAPSKDYNDSLYVKEMCQKKQIQITFVLTGHCNNRHPVHAFDVYYEIAQACSGQAFEVFKTNIEEVLKILDETIQFNKTVISTTIIAAGVKKDIPFTIDDHTDYAIVSISGKNVNLDVIGPSTNLSYTNIVWVANLRVVKLINIKPGSYVATVSGQTRTSVVIVGRTDFFVTHGFSALKPKSLGDTALQPIADANVYLSISVTDDHQTVKIVSAQIVDMDENLLGSALPLTKISEDFYVTESFVAPTQRFKLVVHGIVKATDKPIKRIVKIPITPAAPPKKLPDNTKPTVEIAEGKTINIEYNSTVQLTCKVVAFPAPKIEWVNLKGDRMPSKMSLVEFPYNYISYMYLSNALKEDRYQCYAVNDIGKAENTIGVIVKEPFTVKSAPSGVVKFVYGSEGTITCDVTSGLPMDIHWFYANMLTGQTREIVTSDKYEISASRTQLKIKKMDIDLVGRYECKVSLTNKKDVKKQFYSQVKIDGLTPPKIQGSSEMKIIKGKTAVFECKVLRGVPVPKLTWQFGGKSGSTFTSINSENVLRLSNVEDKHEGKYKCVAENVVGKDEHVTTLFVQDLPKIITDSSVVTYNATEGDDLLRIPCMTTGVPKPFIIWEINGHRIIPSAKYSIENGTLLIRNPKVTDTNKYTCIAKNEAGSASVTFQTYISHLPNITTDSSVVTYKATEGDALLRIPCMASGVPKPFIIWEINGHRIIPSAKYSIENGTLLIRNPKVTDTNKYTCIAKNEAGSASVTFQTYISHLPKMTTDSSVVTYKATEGDDLLRIPCITTGVPKPSIIWKLNDYHIIPSAKYSIEDGMLFIRNPKVTDTNKYTCIAKNEAGSASVTFQTYISQRPKMSGVASKIASLGTPSSIECMVVKGEPKPKITWLFKDKSASKYVPIAGSETTLRIRTAEKNHTGSYKCVAQNTVGTDEHVTELIVECK